MLFPSKSALLTLLNRFSKVVFSRFFLVLYLAVKFLLTLFLLQVINGDILSFFFFLNDVLLSVTNVLK